MAAAKPVKLSPKAAAFLAESAAGGDAPPTGTFMDPSTEIGQDQPTTVSLAPSAPVVTDEHGNVQAASHLHVKPQAQPEGDAASRASQHQVDVAKEKGQLAGVIDAPAGSQLEQFARPVTEIPAVSPGAAAQKPLGEPVLPGQPQASDPQLTSLQKYVLEPRARGGGGGKYIPPQLAMQGMTVQGAMNVPGDVPQGLQMADALDRAAALQHMGAEQEANAIRRNVMEDAVANEEAYQLQQAERQTQRQEHLQQLESVQQQLLAEVLASDISPERYWEKKSAFSRIMARIAIALGAGVAAMGGPNPALEQINKEIDREIDAQKSRIQKLGLSVEVAAGLYGRALQQYRDEDTAEAAAREAYWAQVERRAQLRLSETADAVTQANGMQLLADIERERAANRMKLAQAMQGQVTKKYAMTKGRFVGGGAPKDPMTEMLKRARKAAEFNKLMKELAPRVGAGGDLAGAFPESMKDPQRRKALKEIMDAQRAVESSDRLSKAFEGMGDIPGFGIVAGGLPRTLLSSEGKRLRSEFDITLQEINKAMQGARASDRDLQVVKDAMGAPGFFTSEEVTRQGIRTVRERAQKVYRDRLMESGVDPAALGLPPALPGPGGGPAIPMTVRGRLR